MEFHELCVHMGVLCVHYGIYITLTNYIIIPPKNIVNTQHTHSIYIIYITNYVIIPPKKLLHAGFGPVYTISCVLLIPN